MEIEIYSDVICPWCYLGAVRLAAAVSSLNGEAVLRWRAFQLDPSTPREGEPLLASLGRRFGGVERARYMLAQVASIARSENLNFDFERAVMANTFDAHRLLWFADQPEAVFFGAGADAQPELAYALHRAHFTDGLNVGSHEVLASIAGGVGLDPARVTRLLASNEGTADVRAQIARAHDLGIRAVPTFIFAGRYAVTGALDAATLRSTLHEVIQREGMAPTHRHMVPDQRTAPARDDDSRVA